MDKKGHIQSFLKLNLKLRLKTINTNLKTKDRMEIYLQKKGPKAYCAVL